jgi:hypothetical protein
MYVNLEISLDVTEIMRCNIECGWLLRQLEVAKCGQLKCEALKGVCGLVNDQHCAAETQNNICICF